MTREGESDGLIRARRTGSDGYSYVATLIRIDVGLTSLSRWFSSDVTTHVYIALGIDPEGVRLAFDEGQLTANEVLSWAKDTYPDMQAVLAAGWRIE